MKPAAPARLRVNIRGAVQGVGFRPFVHRLATELGLVGWASNGPQGVIAEVEGAQEAVEQFLLRVETEKPPQSFVQNLEATWLAPAGHKSFEIRASDSTGAKTAFIMPDLATCPECLREILDPRNRRHRYPFTNCTHCGPRFSIIESLPYDRANTSMSRFAMCPQCRAEYLDPANRRFHAQPNACPDCGPQLALWRAGVQEATGEAALLAAAEAIRGGFIVAVKGLGGFHLMVAARHDDAVQRLRERKHREEKPFALMFPSLESVVAVCAVSPLERRLLRSPQAPIVLLRKLVKRNSRIAESVAPGNPNFGVMLPYTPLHHLLLGELGMPVVATSGNASDEPICTDELDALGRLGRIAEEFLVHDRPIVRPVDDSVVRVMAGREVVLRRARGYAPLPIPIKTPASKTNPSAILAVGAHLKNTVALAVGSQVFMSQHIGDLENVLAYETFLRGAADLPRLYDAEPAVVAMDRHPDYLSTRFGVAFTAAGQRRGVPVQHHVAHVLACLAENEVEPPALGVAWDGTGLGLDGTVWGGEFFLITHEKEERVGHFRRFRLPGGDQAVAEPRRAALGLLYDILGEAVFDRDDLAPVAATADPEKLVLKQMLRSGLNAPQTSSVGRLFDAVAALVGLQQLARFEGQAAMKLEFVLEGLLTTEAYPLRFAGPPGVIVDWRLMLESMLEDLKVNVPVAVISAKFHNALIEAIVGVAKRVGQPKVALSGGCFQNRYLTENAIGRLRQEGFDPFWHQRVPTNDGGVALGQIVAALRTRE